MRPIFPIRGRLALRGAEAAIRGGDLRRAIHVCRAYLSTRISSGRLPLRGADAYVAAMAAFCAMLFGDEGEVKGAAGMLQGEGDSATKSAARCVRHFIAALRGDIDEVLASPPPQPSPLSPELAPFVLVVAVEKGYDRLTPARIATIRPRSRRTSGRPIYARGRPSRGRCSRSWPAIARRRRRRSRRWAKTRRRCSRCSRRWPRKTSTRRSNTLLRSRRRSGARPRRTRRCSRPARAPRSCAARSMLSGPTRRRRRARRSWLRSRLRSRARGTRAPRGLFSTSKCRAARGRSRSPSPAAVVALSSGDAARAKEVLRSAPRTDAVVVALHWAALAQGGEDAELAREIGQPAPEIPERYASILGPFVLAALARGGVAPRGDLPEWLRPTSDDAAGLFAWGLVRLWQGHEKDAMDALDRAVSQDQGLAALGDAPEAARLGVAKKRIEEGDARDAEGLVKGVKSARLAPVAARLAAFAFLRRAADARKIELDAPRLSKLVEELAREHAAGTKEAEHLAVLREDLACFRVRSLMREGKMAEARAARKDLPGGGRLRCRVLARRARRRRRDDPARERRGSAAAGRRARSGARGAQRLARRGGDRRSWQGGGDQRPRDGARAGGERAARSGLGDGLPRRAPRARGEARGVCRAPAVRRGLEARAFGRDGRDPVARGAPAFPCPRDGEGHAKSARGDAPARGFVRARARALCARERRDRA